MRTQTSSFREFPVPRRSHSLHPQRAVDCHTTPETHLLKLAACIPRKYRYSLCLSLGKEKCSIKFVTFSFNRTTTIETESQSDNSILSNQNQNENNGISYRWSLPDDLFLFSWINVDRRLSWRELWISEELSLLGELLLYFLVVLITIGFGHDFVDLKEEGQINSFHSKNRSEKIPLFLVTPEKFLKLFITTTT